MTQSKTSENYVKLKCDGVDRLFDEFLVTDTDFTWITRPPTRRDLENSGGEVVDFDLSFNRDCNSVDPVH